MSANPAQTSSPINLGDIEENYVRSLKRKPGAPPPKKLVTWNTRNRDEAICNARILATLIDQLDQDDKARARLRLQKEIKEFAPIPGFSLQRLEIKNIQNYLADTGPLDDTFYDIDGKSRDKETAEDPKWIEHLKASSVAFVAPEEKPSKRPKVALPSYRRPVQVSLPDQNLKDKKYTDNLPATADESGIRLPFDAASAATWIDIDEEGWRRIEGLLPRTTRKKAQVLIRNNSDIADYPLYQLRWLNTSCSKLDKYKKHKDVNYIQLMHPWELENISAADFYVTAAATPRARKSPLDYSGKRNPTYLIRCRIPGKGDNEQARVGWLWLSQILKYMPADNTRNLVKEFAEKGGESFEWRRREQEGSQMSPKAIMNSRLTRSKTPLMVHEEPPEPMEF